MPVAGKNHAARKKPSLSAVYFASDLRFLLASRTGAWYDRGIRESPAERFAGLPEPNRRENPYERNVQPLPKRP